MKFELTWDNGRNRGVLKASPRGKKRAAFETREAAEAAQRQWEAADGVETKFQVVPARAKDIWDAESIEEVQAPLQAAGNLIQLIDLLEQFDDSRLKEKLGDPDLG